MLLAPINVPADETVDYEAVKAETLRLASTTATAGTDGVDTEISTTANMLLYSEKELDREKDHQYSRRKGHTKAVADFVIAIA